MGWEVVLDAVRFILAKCGPMARHSVLFLSHHVCVCVLGKNGWENTLQSLTHGAVRFVLHFCAIKLTSRNLSSARLQRDPEVVSPNLLNEFRSNTVKRETA